MKIALINKLSNGGAFAACNRTRQGLLGEGEDVELLTGDPYWDKFGKSISIGRSLPIASFLSRRFSDLLAQKNYGISKSAFLEKRARTLELFSFPESYFALENYLNRKQYDLINLHWVTGWLNYKTFFKNINTPIVWTLHDMNPFSGGPHFEDRFLRIEDDGTVVRYQKSSFELKVEQKVLQSKKTALRGIKGFGVISPSKWLASKAAESGVFGETEVAVIPNGVDTEVFQDLGKQNCRSVLGLNPELTTFVFVADSIDSVRKGIKLLFKAIESLHISDTLQLCLVGGQFVNSGSIGKHKLKSFGRILDDSILRIIYSAADALILPSLEDNFPNTMLESISCGRPVLAFPVGGIPEAIKSGFNGIISDEISMKSMQRTIVEFVKNRDSFDPIKIRKAAVRDFSIQVNARRYLDYFNRVTVLNKTRV